MGLKNLKEGEKMEEFIYKKMEELLLYLQVLMTSHIKIIHIANMLLALLKEEYNIIIWMVSFNFHTKMASCYLIQNKSMMEWLTIVQALNILCYILNHLYY